ncbi:hypothetical protein C2I38_25370 [Ralstonia solanacearum]|nr:hypothetical protein C2I38_25370 [Ralstonia solanacearum]
MENNRDNDPLIPIVIAIYNSLGKAEKDKVIAEISEHLRDLNKDIKTRGSNGATQVADIAKRITGEEYKLGNGFD